MKRRLLKNSAILQGLGRMADGLYDAMAKSAVGRALTSYDTESKDAEKSLIATKLSAFYRKMRPERAKRVMARGIEYSLICEKIRDFFRSLTNTSVRCVGIFLLAFGFYGMLMFLLTNYATDRLPAVSLSHLFFDLSVMAVAAPMLFSGKAIGKAISESRTCDVVLFGILGVRRESAEGVSGHNGIGASTSFILGTIFGIITLFIPPYNVMLGFFSVFVGYAVLVSPESGVVLCAFLIPFVSSDMLGFLMIYIIICFAIKLMRGKRTLSLDLKDYAVLLFGVVILLGGVFSIDPISFTYSVKLLSYILAYIVIINLVRSRKWLERLKAAFILSVVITALTGIFQYVAISSTHYLSEDTYLGNEVTAFFGSSSVLALYLGVGSFFVIAELIKNENTIRKLFMLLMSIAVMVCLYLTNEPLIMLATVISAVIFFLVYSNRTIFLLIPALLILPVSRFIAPVSVKTEFERLLALASEQIAERMPIWQTSLYMANDHLLSGSGVGTYKTLFTSYANESLGSALDSSNLYLQSIIDVGLFGLIVFLIVVFLYIQHCFSVFATEGGGKKTIFTAAGVAAVVFLLLCGAFLHVWAETRIFLCLWFVMGLATASGNLRLGEHRGMNAFLD